MLAVNHQGLLLLIGAVCYHLAEDQELPQPI
jgi:hypothetical protein